MTNFCSALEMISVVVECLCLHTLVCTHVTTLVSAYGESLM